MSTSISISDDLRVVILLKKLPFLEELLRKKWFLKSLQLESHFLKNFINAELPNIEVVIHAVILFYIKFYEEQICICIKTYNAISSSPIELQFILTYSVYVTHGLNLDVRIHLLHDLCNIIYMFYGSYMNYNHDKLVNSSNPVTKIDINTSWVKDNKFINEIDESLIREFFHYLLNTHLNQNILIDNLHVNLISDS